MSPPFPCPCCVFCLFPRGAAPYSLSPVLFHFHLPLQCPLFLPLFPLLFISFSVWKESCPGKPPPSSFGGKDWRQETNPSSCLLETSRLIFPSQEQNTKGCWPHQWPSRRSVRSYCSFLSIQCGLLWELLLTFP